MTYQDRLAAFVRSTRFTKSLYVLCAIVVACAIFAAGVAVGYRKAEFASRWGENYGRNFGGPGSAFGFGGRMPNPHGTFGKVLSIASSTITIAGPKQPEQKVIVDAATIIRDRENTVALDTLKEGDSIVVLGAPNGTGEIKAKLIRVLPPPPAVPTPPGVPAVPSSTPAR